VSNFFVFVSQEWLLVSVLVVLVYLYAWRERVKSGLPISAHEVTRLLNSETAVLLDVRDAAEFKAGHIAGAVNIPFGKINSDISQLEAHKNKIIVVADKLGQHAGVVGRTLAKQGYVVRRLAGGIAEWQSQNLPLVKK
jgi:rhodanese-related sulfurtransferase